MINTNWLIKQDKFLSICLREISTLISLHHTKQQKEKTFSWRKKKFSSIFCVFILCVTMFDVCDRILWCMCLDEKKNNFSFLFFSFWIQMVSIFQLFHYMTNFCCCCCCCCRHCWPMFVHGLWDFFQNSFFFFFFFFLAVYSLYSDFQYCSLTFRVYNILLSNNFFLFFLLKFDEKKRVHQ